MEGYVPVFITNSREATVLFSIVWPLLKKMAEILWCVLPGQFQFLFEIVSSKIIREIRVEK